MNWTHADAKFKGDIYCTLIFQQSSMICIGHHTLVTWPATNSLILRKRCGLKSQITIIILLKIWHTNRFSKVKSYNFHFHKYDAAWQSELNSDVARFTTHIKPVLQQIRLLTGLNEVSKPRNIPIQLALQQCCMTSCTFFVARFSVSFFLQYFKVHLNYM